MAPLRASTPRSGSGILDSVMPNPPAQTITANLTARI
jgi:hypothetical protein